MSGRPRESCSPSCSGRRRRPRSRSRRTVSTLRPAPDSRSDRRAARIRIPRRAGRDRLPCRPRSGGGPALSAPRASSRTPRCAPPRPCPGPWAAPYGRAQWSCRGKRPRGRRARAAGGGRPPREAKTTRREMPEGGAEPGAGQDVGRGTVGHEAPWGVAGVLHGELANPAEPVRGGGERSVQQFRDRVPVAEVRMPDDGGRHAARAIVPAGAHRRCPVGEFDLADRAQQIRPVSPRHGQRLDIDRGKDDRLVAPVKPLVHVCSVPGNAAGNAPTA
jgi:hypothetical protein